MRVLLVEPYLTGSHRAWAEGYAAHSGHKVELVAHDGRFWRWRMQGGALTLAAAIDDAVARGGPADVVLASDMVHLPALLGLARRSIGDAGVALYLHENQLTYPPGPRQAPDLTYAMTNWLSMAAADRVFVNSAFHRDELLDELPRLLKHFPDHSHLPWLDDVAARVEVLPVGVDLRALEGPRPDRGDQPPLVLWNARWEHDKDPATFVDALCRLADDGVPFRVALAGEQVAPVADEVGAARRRLDDRVVHVGCAPDDEYAALLRQADVVVSTARHEFFGVGVVEAVHAGAFPVLPDRLSYPELVPAELHETCLYRTPDELHERLRWAVTRPADAAAVAVALRPAATRFDWSVVAPRYDAALVSLA